MTLVWEAIEVQNSGTLNYITATRRAKVPGGWLVAAFFGIGYGNGSLSFYPDPNHVWAARVLGDKQ
jgi:hypothetical protein